MKCLFISILVVLSASCTSLNSRKPSSFNQKSNKINFYSNLSKPRYIIAAWSSEESMNLAGKLSKVVRKINKKDNLNIKVIAAYQDSDSPPKTLETSNEHNMIFVPGRPYQNNNWFQDSGQFGYHGDQLTFVPSELGMNKSENIFFKKLTRKIPFKINPIKIEADGGNFEVLPDGTPYTGLENFPKTKTVSSAIPIKIPMDYSIVGHVDESYTVIPSNTGCGFALMFASPIEGLQIVTKNKRLHLHNGNILDSFKYFSKTSTKPHIDEIKNTDEFLNQFDLSRNIRIPAKYEYNFADWLVFSSIKSQIQINKGLSKMTSHLKQSCQKDIKVIETPVLARASIRQFTFATGTEEEESAEALDYDWPKTFKVNFLTPFNNSIVLENNIIFPEMDYPEAFLGQNIMYKELVEDLWLNLRSKLYSIGYKKEDLHRVSVGNELLGGGALHCLTLVIRDKEEGL